MSCERETVVTQNKLVYVYPPLIYRSCKDEPVAPPHGASKDAWATYMLEEQAFGRDCKSKVDGGNQWIIHHQQEELKQ